MEQNLIVVKIEINHLNLKLVLDKLFNVGMKLFKI